jgi:hypothetical protein
MITIKPQDKTKPEKLELELHPNLIKRLQDYAKSLDDSDLNYVAAQIFEQVLPVDRGSKKAKTAPAEKPKKEKPAKAA